MKVRDLIAAGNNVTTGTVIARGLMVMFNDNRPNKNSRKLVWGE